MLEMTEAAAIVHSLIDLGKTLDLELIAEGVELEVQLLELQRQHCNKAQGYFFARPLAPEDLPAFVARQNGLSPATVS